MGYAEDAQRFAAAVESISFTDVHRPVLHLIPTTPGLVLDLGAGTGRDAAALASIGHSVIAVEPVSELRTIGITLHPSPRIEWIDDNLPLLTKLGERAGSFDLTMLTAVWMHLDPPERRLAMPAVARLMKPGGVMILSLRHGPVPQSRRMFEVSTEETKQLAEGEGLRLVLAMENQPSAIPRADVTWTRLAFRR